MFQKEKKCLECVIASREVEANDLKRRKLDQCHDSTTIKLAESLEELDGLREALESSKVKTDLDLKEMSRLEFELNLLLIDFSKVLLPIPEAQLEAQLTKTNLLLEDNEEEQRRNARLLEKLLKKHVDNSKEIKRLEKEIEATRPKYNKHHDNCRAASIKLEKLRITQTRLHDKSNCASNVFTEGERKAQLKANAKAREAELLEIQSAENRTKNDIAKLEATLASVKASEGKKELEMRWKNVDVLRKSQTDMYTQLNTWRLEHNQLSEALKDISHKIRVNNAEINDATRKLNNTMRHSQVTANQAGARWALETKNENCVFGTLIENIEIDEQYHIPVETAGGSQLFNLLVKNIRVALEVLDYIKQHKEGSTIIVPLDDIMATRDTNMPYYPTVSEDQYIPLTSVIKCPEHVRPAVNQLFGRYLLVKNIEVGRTLSHGFDTITAEGDTFSRKGTISGGHRGHQTRLLSSSKIKFHTGELDNLERSRVDAEERIHLISSNINGLEEQIKEIKREITVENITIETLTAKLCVSSKEIVSIPSQLAKLSSLLSDLVGRSEIVTEALQGIRREMSSPFVSQLSAEEIKEIRAIATEVTNAQADLAVKQKAFAQEESKLGDIETRLNEVLIPNAIKIENEILDLKKSDDKIPLLQQEKISLETRRTQVQREISSLQSSVESSMKALRCQEDEVQNLSNRERDVKAAIDTLRNDIRSIQGQLEVFRTKSDEFSIKTVLGGADLMNEFGGLEDDELATRLISVNHKLKRFDNVNRKAEDQATSFLDEENRLIAQREALYNAEDSILELVNTLDNQKDASLLRTFENVNAQFEHVFDEIAPGGKAKLVLIKKNEERDENVVVRGDIFMNNNNKLDVFEGVGVKVKFPGHQTYQALESLSGGQKCTVALALMFALQRVDPAPFYILDEVDSSLDTQYRGTVAALIQKQARSNQFVVVSHKLETIQAATWFIKTSMTNQTTTLSLTNLDDAIIVSQVKSS